MNFAGLHVFGNIYHLNAELGIWNRRIPETSPGQFSCIAVPSLPRGRLQCRQVND